MIDTLTREEDSSLFGPSVRKGRVGVEVMREVITDPTAPLVYVCGPGISKWDREVAREKGTAPQPRFLESVLANLKEIGVPNSRIKREFYG